MLTMQLIRIMDKLWLKEGLDLKMVTFSCQPTGLKRGDYRSCVIHSCDLICCELCYSFHFFNIKLRASNFIQFRVVLFKKVSRGSVGSGSSFEMLNINSLCFSSVCLFLLTVVTLRCRCCWTGYGIRNAAQNTGQARTWSYWVIQRPNNRWMAPGS